MFANVSSTPSLLLSRNKIFMTHRDFILPKKLEKENTPIRVRETRSK